MAEFLRIKVDRYDSNGNLSYPEQIGFLYDYTYNSSRMSDDAPTINGKFLSKNQISFQVKDEGKPDVVYYNPFHTFVEYEGVKYYLLRPPISTKNNTEERYEYDFTFVSPIKKLQDKLFVDCVTYPFNENEEYFSNSTTFSIAVTAKEFARRLNYSGLVDLGFYVKVEDITTDTETKFLTIDKLSYLDAIKIFKETFEMDYYIESKSSEITIGTITYNLIRIRIKQYDTIVNDTYNELNITHIIPFEYGSTNALMSITKTPKTDKVITRMTGIGSADNIPYYYPNETPKGGYLSIQIPNNDSQVHIVDKDVLNNVVNETDYFTHKSYDSGSGSIEWRGNGIKYYETVFILEYINSRGTYAKKSFDAKLWVATANTIHTNGDATKQISYTKYVELPENDIKLNSFYFTFDWETCKNEIITKINTLVDNANKDEVGFGIYADLFKDHLKWYVFNQPLKSPNFKAIKSNNKYNFTYNPQFNPEEVLDGWLDIFIKDNAGNEIKLYSINGYYQIPNGDFNTETIELDGVEKKVTKIYVRLKTIADNRRLFVVPLESITISVVDEVTNGENDINKNGVYDDLFYIVYNELFKQNADNINYIQSLFDKHLQLVNPTWVHVKDVNGLNDSVVDFSKYGLEVADDYFYNITFERKDKYINPSPNLMPSIYRNSKGKRRFYDAIDYPRKVESNNVPIDQNAGEEQPINLEIHNNLYKKDNNTYLVFDNPIVDTSVIESVVEFEDIKPSIKFVVNDNGQPINKILGVAFDCQDENGEIDWERENAFIVKDDNKEYEHPYFFVKLPALGFNLFTHASEKGAMSVSMTSGHSASCTFEIGVSEKSKKNFVALDPNNNLVRDNNGNVICNRRVYILNGAVGKYDISDINITTGNLQINQFPDKFEQQIDTTNNEVWIALKKDLNTFGTLMPAFESAISSGDEFVLLNIDLPFEYVLNAERELSKAIIKELHEQNRDKVSFSVDFSSIFFEEDKANKGVGREDDYFINKLTENSCLEIKYLSKVYRLFVSNYTKTFSSDSVLPKITISVQENITPIKRITLNNLRPTISNENRFVTLNGINRDTLTIQKTTDNIGLNTSGIYESSDSVVDSLVTTGATIKTANFGVNSKGDLTINVKSQTSSSKDGSQVESVSMPKFYEDTQKELQQLKSDIQSITNKVDEDVSSNVFASYIWYGRTAGTNAGNIENMLAMLKDGITTLEVIVKLNNEDFDANSLNYIINLIQPKETNEVPSIGNGYNPYSTYEFIFKTQIGEQDVNTLPNLDIVFTLGKNNQDVYTLGHRDKFVVEITTYETTYSYRIKQNVASSFDKDFQKIQEEIKKLNSNLNQKVGDVKVDNVSVVENGVASIDLATPINEALNSLRIGLPKGVATLDNSGKVPQNQLPSYVDDVLEFNGLSNFPTTGESGKIYVDASTNKSYRWSGTKYTEISNSLAIGTINGTAADGGVAQSHYNDNTRHITDAERNNWNGKQNTHEELLISKEVNTNSQPPFSTSKKSIYEWLTSLWEYAYVVSERLRYVENLYSNKYVSDALTGNTGTILASTHKCGKTPKVQAWLNGAFVLCDISVNSAGDVTWTSNEKFISSSNFKLIIHG